MANFAPPTPDVPAGEWHLYRRDHRLSGHSPLPGHIDRPTILWSFMLGGSENECHVLPGARGRSDLLFTYGGCVLRMDGRGKQVWKSAPYGINSIGAVVDLDGDALLEIVCSTGYEVIVLAAESGRLLMRTYVGFPLSGGTQASTLLCHRFDERSAGMHLIIPLMSSKEVLVFDFRNGNRQGIQSRTLWMDDAFHPTVAAADMDNDGVDELVVSKLCGLYVFDVLTGTMKHSFRWTSNGERHRNYGLLQLKDIDGDGAREVVIVAERVARHIAVIDNDGKGNFSLLWDHFVEFIYPSDTTELRHTGNSLEDVDGDGKPELVVSLFNARKDGRWWLEILDPLSGKLKLEMPDTYLWGIHDLDGDGIGELFLGEERERNPAPYSTVRAVRVKGLRVETLWKHDHAHFAGESLRPSGWKSNFRPVQFGHDETWVDQTPRGMTFFLFTVGEEGLLSLTEVTWREGRISSQSVPLGSRGTFVMAALADVDGDGQRECILSEDSGRILVARAGKGVLASWMVGFRLQLEGFSAARPGPVPVVYRARGEARPLILVPDNRRMLHQLQLDTSARSVVERWKRPGRGWMGYDNCYHAAYVCDLGGERRILAANPDRPDCSELLSYGTDGEVKASWLFREAPPCGPMRIGLYQWVVAGERIVGSFYASYSMNSEQTLAIDLKGKKLWQRAQEGEGEWGRGVGPWSAFSVRDGGKPEILFLAKDLLCRLDAETGRWIGKPWILWQATNSIMNQPDWDFSKKNQADFGSLRDPFTAYGSPILVDLDRDGEEEILVGGCFGGFGALRQDLSILWWLRTPFTDMMLRLPGIADLEGNGKLSVGISRADGTFTSLDGATGRERWSIPLGSTTSDIASADIDGDGREEFIAATTDGRLLALGAGANGEGEIRWSLELGFALGSPVIADADGDGSAEILLVAGDGRLLCIGKEK